MMQVSSLRTRLLRPLFFSTTALRTELKVSASSSSSSSSSRQDGRGLPKGSLDVKGRYRLEEEMLSGLPDRSRPYLVLGIESSCDDTGVSVVRSDGVVLSNIVYSQHDIHANFGGVVPSLAMEAHKANIDLAVERAIREAGLQSIEEIDGIAVTKGPGLEICLRVGLRKAQELARNYTKPFVTVHHLEAHCMVARLAGEGIVNDTTTSNSSNNSSIPRVEFPFLALLASGGHTSLLVVRDLGQYDLLGGTLDDALGEAFDKAGRLLGLRSPSGSPSGGPAIERMARLYKEKYALDPTKPIFRHSMSVPLRQKANCDFSYSGLKNSFRNEVAQTRKSFGLSEDATNAPTNQMAPIEENLVTLPEEVTAYLCHAFQDVAFTHVEDRLKRALRTVRPRLEQNLTALVLVGGVASNQELRRRLTALVNQESSPERPPLPLIFPPIPLCTDNAVMVAWTGIEKFNRGISNSIEGQEVSPRWPLGAPLDLSSLVASSTQSPST
eukprot:gene4505-4941_t